MRIDINENNCFVYRVAGVIKYQNQVLLHRAGFDDFWTLPGGGCNFFENSAEALKREFTKD